MPKPNRPLDAARQAQLLAELHRDHARRQQSYRERALKLFAHLCARCGREFSGKRLLCVYCHDHEHEKIFLGQYYSGAPADDKPPPATFQPFAGLDTLLKPRRDESTPGV